MFSIHCHFIGFKWLKMRFYWTSAVTIYNTLIWSIFFSAIHISGPNFTEKGEPIRISCNATSDNLTPDHHMDWFRDGIKIKPNPDEGILITEYRRGESKTLYSELEIVKSTMKDAGTYICRSSRRDVVSHHVVVLNGKS